MAALTLFLKSQVYRKVYKKSCNLLPWCFSQIHMGSPNYGKHWDPKWKKERREKVLKIDLPNFEEGRNQEKLTPEKLRSILKSKGIAPTRHYTERPINITATGAIFEAYVPPEGDGKLSLISTEGAKQKLEVFGKKSKSLLALRTIRRYEEDFDSAEFANKAKTIYIDAHEALMNRDEDKLHDLVTEKCFPEMMGNIELKTVQWKYLESLELPRVVHVRCTDIITKDNIFGQVTVRFHSKQMLAIYDRFGRLMFGSEVIPKIVLEYVVFEKHLVNTYGLWRIHGKVIPDWMPRKESVFRTFQKTPIEETSDLPEKEETTELSEEQPAIATS